MRNVGFRCSRLAVFPIGGIDDFLNTGFQDGIEVFALFYEDVFTIAIVLTVEINDGMTGSTGTSEIIQNVVVFLGCYMYYSIK